MTNKTNRSRLNAPVFSLAKVHILNNGWIFRISDVDFVIRSKYNEVRI